MHQDSPQTPEPGGGGSDKRGFARRAAIASAVVFFLGQCACPVGILWNLALPGVVLALPVPEQSCWLAFLAADALVVLGLVSLARQAWQPAWICGVAAALAQLLGYFLFPGYLKARGDLQVWPSFYLLPLTPLLLVWFGVLGQVRGPRRG